MCLLYYFDNLLISYVNLLKYPSFSNEVFPVTIQQNAAQSTALKPSCTVYVLNVFVNCYNNHKIRWHKLPFQDLSFDKTDEMTSERYPAFYHKANAMFQMKN